MEWTNKCCSYYRLSVTCQLFSQAACWLLFPPVEGGSWAPSSRVMAGKAGWRSSDVTSRHVTSRQRSSLMAA